MVSPTQTRSAQNPLLESRVLLGRGIEDGIDPPEEFEPGILLRGRVHQIFSGAGTGKSFVALWLVMAAIGRGERVLYMDMENGPRIVSERLGALGVDAGRVDDLLVYLSSPGLSLAAERGADYEALLDEVRPELVVFDSWVGFLGAAGLEENSNDDVTRWSVAFAHPARKRGVTVVILDHVPWEAKRSRGASRKKDEADVQWQLRNPAPFDRATVGEVILEREKDREGWLPPSVTLSIGGTEDGFLCERSAGTVRRDPGDGLTKTQRKALMVLRTDFAGSGVGFNDWQRKVNCSSGTLFTAIKRFTSLGLVENRSQVYFPVDLGAEEVSDG